MTKLVAINGLGGHGFMWDGFRNAYPRAVQVVDLPGHGDAPRVDDYGYSSLVAYVLTKLPDDPHADVIGWSVGAAVGWLLAARHPDRVRRLVLVEPAAPHQSPFRDGPIPDPIHSHTFASPEKALQALRTVDSSATAAEVAGSYRMDARGRLEPRFDPAIYSALVRDAQTIGEELYFELERIEVPVLIIRGERSFVRADQIDEIRAALRHVEVRTVGGAGHFVVKERPLDVAALVADFLACPDV